MSEQAVKLAVRLYEIERQIKGLQLTKLELTEQLANEMTDDQLEVPGLGVFERRVGKERKSWDHGGIRRAVLRAMRDGVVKPDRHVDANGEITEEQPDEFAFRVLNEVAHIDYWKSRSLKALDIQIDEFCESKPGKVSIQIHANVEPEVGE